MMHTREIKIVAANPNWPTHFAEITQDLRPFFPLDANFHHIGSTAVAGLAAKNIIDIQVSVENIGSICTQLIESAGYKYFPDATDHAPAGLNLPSKELHKMFFKAVSRSVHLHVRERGRYNHRYALLFRDFLRATPLATAAYESIKLELESRFSGNPEAYYAVKDPVCDLIIVEADEWAKRNNWHEPDTQ